MKKNVALALSGGGARGAYEAGVLRGIAELGLFKASPFQIITGVSAGAINGMALAAHIENFDLATRKLWQTWEKIRVQDVFRTDPPALLKTFATFAKDFSFGQWFGGGNVTHLLDSSPLRSFLKKNIDLSQVGANLRAGRLRALSLSATDYQTGRLVTFFDGDPGIRSWDEAANCGVRTDLSVRHIMASTAIPIFFAPVRIEDTEYGDGGIGIRSPLSDAIHLGADKIFVVGLQYSPAKKPVRVGRHAAVNFGDIAGTVMNALFTNSLDSDLGRLEETNQTLTELNAHRRDYRSKTVRIIPSYVIHPSQDLGTIDAAQFSRLPFPLRHLLKGLGVSEQKGWDLLSYLAFEKGYVGVLLELGRQDAHSQNDAILKFLSGASPSTA